MIQTGHIHVRQASVADIGLLVPLFDAYRVFYGQTSDLEVARAFLLERFRYQQSVLFIALLAHGKAVGFAQLYPSFSSVSAAPTCILNDLYVVPELRRSGVATKLLEAAATYGREVGAIRLSLSTAIDNESAISLYVAQGWMRDTQYHAYHLPLGPSKRAD